MQKNSQQDTWPVASVAATGIPVIVDLHRTPGIVLCSQFSGLILTRCSENEDKVGQLGPSQQAYVIPVKAMSGGTATVTSVLVAGE